MTQPPAIVRELADAWVCEPDDPQGSAAKLRWTREWSGLYLGCDDDLVYPPDYVETMLRWVRRWRGRAIVCCHGRVLRPRASGFKDASMSVNFHGVETTGSWLNYPGACAIAWDSRLQVPTRAPAKSCEEAALAVWAQQTRTPVWLVPHAADWLGYSLQSDAFTIWGEEKATGFERRNGVLQQLRSAWRVHRCR
jgi:hypothetical protein